MKIRGKSWHKSAEVMKEKGISSRKIAKILGIGKSTVNDYFYKKNALGGETLKYKSTGGVNPKPTKPVSSCRMLFLDIETSFLVTNGWGLFNQYFSLEQLERDWTIISISWKWLEDDKASYIDITDDPECGVGSEDAILNKLWELLHEANVVVAHNGRKFDLKKIRARMIAKGFLPYSPVRVVDTLEISKNEFAFTSNKLAYLTKLLCKGYVKDGHEKFPGFVLWKEFLSNNPLAQKEMREYNMIDVLSLQELYGIMAPWSSKLPQFEVYEDSLDMSVWEEDGFCYTNLGKYKQYRNSETGQWRRGRINLLSKEKRESLLANIIG